MTPPSRPPEKGEEGLAALTELARDTVRPPSSAQLNRGWTRLSASVVGARARPRRALLLAGTMALASLVVAATLLTASRPRGANPVAPALAYRIEGGNLVAGGYLRDTGADGIKLSFSEGTEFVLKPGARGRLGAVDGAGARIAIEEGTASFQVTPRPGARWMIDVGPFLVTVKGTAFTVSWNAASERFELDLRQGRVTISGPISGGDIALRAGQRLVVNLPEDETLITEENLGEPSRGKAPATAPPSEAPGAGDERAPSTPSARAVRNDPPAPARPRVAHVVHHRWAEALAAGQLDQILLDAEQAGLKSALEESSSEELYALATAARYRQRVDLARDALLAERRRFAGSNRALDAAFFLGRLEESSGRGTTRAMDWYDEYLLHAPTGRYASQALGRKMIAASRTEGAAQAARLAEEYLRRFPNGSYAGSARALRPLR